MKKNKVWVYPITTHLFEQYGIIAQPGQRTTCPKCGKQSFYVRSKNYHGLCNDRKCGYKLNSRCKGETKIRVDSILREVYDDFKKELLSPKTKASREACDYMLNHRYIHSQVLEDAHIGLVPANYDLDAKFVGLIKELNGKDCKLTPEKRDQIISIRDNLRSCFDSHQGDLAFFYLDDYTYITSIRFHKPFTDKFDSITLFSENGIFGHDLYFPTFPELGIDPTEIFCITETEFDFLRWQSLALRIESEYLNGCAIGYLNQPDLETIQRITVSPILCVNGNGKQLIQLLKQSMNLEYFTVPEKYKNLDEFIRSFGTNYNAAWDGVFEKVNEYIPA